MALKIDLRPGESLKIGNATVKLVKKSGQLASLVVEADRSVLIEGPIKEGEDGTDASPSHNCLSFANT